MTNIGTNKNRFGKFCLRTITRLELPPLLVHATLVTLQASTGPEVKNGLSGRSE